MSVVCQLSMPHCSLGAAARVAQRQPAGSAAAAHPALLAATQQWATSRSLAHGSSSSSSSRQPTWCCHATDFHQSLLAATERDPAAAPPPMSALVVREAEADDELQAASWLRALSFYRYPAERKFAAQVHRTMVAEEEYKELKMAVLNRRLGRTDSNERSACLVAVCPAAELSSPSSSSSSSSSEEELHDQLRISGGNGAGRVLLGDGGAVSSIAAANELVVVGTLDLYAVRALQGEVLIGDSRNAAYLANVCTAAAARRRGVGQAMLEAARQLATDWGVDALYVHTMAVNEIAVRFYERNGFVVEKEESSNQAHYRGRCLDGIEGRGRTVLMRDTLLYA